MNQTKDLPKIYIQDLSDYTIINRVGVFNTKNIYVAEELKINIKPKTNKEENNTEHTTTHIEIPYNQYELTSKITKTKKQIRN